MKQYYTVLDTNVLVSALLSHNAVSSTVALLDHILTEPSFPFKTRRY